MRCQRGSLSHTRLLRCPHLLQQGKLLPLKKKKLTITFLHCKPPTGVLYPPPPPPPQSRQDKRPFASFKAGSQPDTLVQDLKWSPAEAFRVAACLSDGSMMVLDVTDKIVPVAQLPPSVGITCSECVLAHLNCSGIFIVIICEVCLSTVSQ